MIQKIGYVLLELGGIAVLTGFLMVKFPRLFSLFGKLPGDININNRVYLYLGTSVALSVILSLISFLINFLARNLK